MRVGRLLNAVADEPLASLLHLRDQQVDQVLLGLCRVGRLAQQLPYPRPGRDRHRQ